MISIEKVGDYNTCCVSPLGAFNYNLLPWYESAQGMASKAQFEAQKGYIEALKYAKKYGPVRSPSASDVYARLERGRTRTEAGIRKIFDVDQPEKRAQAEMLQAQRAIPSTGVEITPVITTSMIQPAPSRKIQSSIIYMTPIPRAVKPEWPKTYGGKQVWSQEEINQMAAAQVAEQAEIFRLRAQEAGARAAISALSTKDPWEFLKKQQAEERAQKIEASMRARQSETGEKGRVFYTSRMSPEAYYAARAAQAKMR